MNDATIQQMNAYFDGLLSASERTAFEQRLQIDSELRETVEAQQEISRSLRRVMAIPAVAPAMPAAAARAAGEGDLDAQVAGVITATHTAPWLRWLAMAALISAGLFGVWSTWRFLSPGDDREMIVRITPEKYYQEKVADGGQVYWYCKPDSEVFANTFRAQFGQALAMLGNTPGVMCKGFGRCNAISDETHTLVMTADQTLVIVLIDRCRTSCGLSVSPESGLHLHKREIGTLVLYEISPLATARVLDLFQNPDAPGPASG